MIRGMNPLSAGSYQSERYGGTLGYGVCYNIILMRDAAGRIGVEYALTDQQDCLSGGMKYMYPLAVHRHHLSVLQDSSLDRLANWPPLESDS